MTDERKQDFTRRICNANETELLSLVLEMTDTYIEDMIHELEEGKIQLMSYQHFEKCIRHLENSVWIGDQLGLDLFSLYRYVETEVSKAFVIQEREKLEHSRQILQKLEESFYQLSQKDTKGPVIQNAEQVYIGLTYSGSGLDVSSIGSTSNRGFLA